MIISVTHVRWAAEHTPDLSSMSILTLLVLVCTPVFRPGCSLCCNLAALPQAVD